MKHFVLSAVFVLGINVAHAELALADSPAKTDGQSGKKNQPESATERDARMAWWREGKFGMFVHWGVYSVVGGQYNGQELPNSAEWMMAKGKIPIAEYEQYAKQFNPAKFDADKFVGRAKRAGMKYLVITAKHHDGFAMFGSKATDYNVVDFSPFGRDIMKELADACQKQGIKFGVYYSQAQDWHHPGGFGNGWDKTIKRVSSDEYVKQKAAPEVEQLLTEYGPIGIFWWDTPRAMSRESFLMLHSLTKLQPSVITNDRLGEDFPGDYKTFERKIPSQVPEGKDWEVCMPISGSWGYKKSDTKFKSLETLIRNLVDIVSKGGNYLLNVSPTGEGTLLPQSIERLEGIGKWMDVNSESIYAATASPIGRPDWGRCTAKIGDTQTTLYLHVFDWPNDGKLNVAVKNSVTSASLLDGGDSLTFKTSGDAITIQLPGEAPDPHASVIKLVIDGKPEVTATATAINAAEVRLKVDQAFIHNNEGSRDARVVTTDGQSHIGYWTDDQAYVEWNVAFKQPGDYEVVAEVAMPEGESGVRVGTPGNMMEATVKATGDYYNFQPQTLGVVKIESSGTVTLRVKPISGAWQAVNLRSLRLSPPARRKPGRRKTADKAKAKQPYDGSWQSLQKMPVPAWFDDGKVGIFIHWGPYSAIGYRKGDRGYAEHVPKMLYEDSAHYYPYMKQRWGSTPPEFGYKDIIPEFKAENWNPDEWAELFADVGARYVVLTAEHHDGWANWDSDLTPWNAVDMGPKRDLVGDLGEALRMRGLNYAPSFHRERHTGFFAKQKYAVHSEPRPDIAEEIRRVPGAASLYGPFSYDKAFVDDYVARWKEIQTKYQPDFLWVDDFPIYTRDGNRVRSGKMKPEIRYLDDQVCSMITDFMNDAAARGQEVYCNNKGANRNWPDGVGCLEKDNLKLKVIGPKWQSCTTFGTSFGYMAAEEDPRYPHPKKTARDVIHEMVEVISRNGNFLINIGPKGDGTIPAWQVQRLRAMGDWLKVNGDAIYGTRYWKVNEQPSEHLAFTTKGKTLYAIKLSEPEAPFTIEGTSGWESGQVKSVRLLGCDSPVSWVMTREGLQITPPPNLGASQFAWSFEIQTSEEQHHPNAIETDATKAFQGTKKVNLDGNATKERRK